VGVKILLLRHRLAAPPEGCRWCGFRSLEHANRWVPSRKWHTFEHPTREQILARTRVLRDKNRGFTMPGNDNPYGEVASRERTRL
jgi:hypothetical protein